MNTSSPSIVIIGAGPAGATAAIALAQKNIAVTLIDKATFPRDKICGDALSGKVVDVLNLLNKNWVHEIAADSLFLGSYGVSFFAPNQQSLAIPFQNKIDKSKPAPGFISKRIDFDNFLIKKVKEFPQITLIENTVCRNFERKENKIICKTTNGEFTADVVLAADGVNSAFAKQFSTIEVESNHNCFGLRAYFDDVKNLDENNFIELHFLKEFLPGYFWIFPLPNGGANVGVGLRADVIKKNNINLRKSFLSIIENNSYLKERFASAKMQGEIKQWSLPLASKKRLISGENFMLLGDAAMLIDPFTGEGISNAMYSGYFAANTIANCMTKKDFSAEKLLAYDHEVYRRLGPEFKVSYRMQQLVNFPWLFNFIVKRANSNPTLKETIASMFEDIDLRAKLKSPKFYFNLLFSR